MLFQLEVAVVSAVALSAAAVASVLVVSTVVVSAVASVVAGVAAAAVYPGEVELVVSVVALAESQAYQNQRP